MNAIIKHIFYGNYFYGYCAIALTIEATLQQQISFNHPIYYLIVFCATVVYYIKAYTHLNDADSVNDRVKWYHSNKKLMLYTEIVFYCIIISSIVYYTTILPINKNLLHKLPYIIIVPLVGLLYYGFSLSGLGKNNLRKIGWLKPVLIGFTWAGIVTLYPLVFNTIEQDKILSFNMFNILLFIKNMMFVIVLCIMFDVKDYASDYNKDLKTFVVHFGLRKTIFFILLPLCIIGLGSFLIFGIIHQFSWMKIFLNTIPFVSMLWVAYSLKNRRSIIYYLIIIDGLMLLKAICGSIAMYYF